MQEIKVLGKPHEHFELILTEGALQFVSELQRNFGARREQLLEFRSLRQKEFDSMKYPTFLRETEQVRLAPWKVAEAPADMEDRRVEITGPSGDTKMVINAFNSGANTFMADFEDAQSPTWHNCIRGQINLHDAIRRKISYKTKEKNYVLNDRVATLIVRPRGWHLLEEHMLVYDKPVSASLFDFGLFLFHNWKELLQRASGPYFYLPKLESRLEARLWNDVFAFSEERLGVPRFSIKATVLIETILAAFEMDEILYEMRDYCVGLNCGRWDYIFSFIKKFRENPEFVLPDRSLASMDKAFLKAYVDLLIKTCHRRGAHAIGGMSAFIPVKINEQANRVAFQKVREDKEREVKAGHDGTWVAHPGLVPLAKQVFDELMPGPNQIESKPRSDVVITESDLLKVPLEKEITEKGLATNVSVGLLYIEAWLGGRGAVPLYNLMEDAATAEICRAQIWQWIRHRAKLTDGRTVTKELFEELLATELARHHELFATNATSQRHFEQAARIFSDLVLSDTFSEFLTMPAYAILLGNEEKLVETESS